MSEPQEPPTGRTNRRLIGILAAVVLVGVFAGLLVWRLAGRTDTAQPNHPPAGVQPLAGHQFCGGSILIYTNTDADMQRIAQALGADPRAAGVFTRTKQESYTVYQRDFADQPSLLTLARPAALPAEIQVLPAANLDPARLADQLRAQFPAAQTVDWVPRATTCPANGEWPSPTR
jgi:hypothetical protein